MTLKPRGLRLALDGQEFLIAICHYFWAKLECRADLLLTFFSTERRNAIQTRD